MTWQQVLLIIVLYDIVKMFVEPVVRRFFAWMGERGAKAVDE